MNCYIIAVQNLEILFETYY